MATYNHGNPLTFNTFGGKEITDYVYHPEKRSYTLELEDGKQVEVTEALLKDTVSPDMFPGTYHPDTKPNLMYEVVAYKAELDRLKEEFKETIVQLTKTFEEQLDHERRLRTEAVKFAEHLLDQVSNPGGNLQGGYDTSSGLSSPGRQYYVQPNTGDAPKAEVSTGRPDTSHSRVASKDDAVQLLREWKDRG